MKWSIPELRRKQHTHHQFSETIDLQSYLPDDGDILDVSPVSVQGAYRIEGDRYFHFNLIIDAVLVVACARTLEPVEVPMHIEVVETFSETAHPEYRLIEGITVDLSPIIWSNIYLEKPFRVVKPGATFESATADGGEKAPNPMFEALKKYKKR